MALTDKLRNLDQKLLPGTRGDEEDAESYLRRVASSRAISPAQAGDVMAALRQYFGVEEGGDAAQSGEAEGDGESGAAEDEQPRDEAEESDDDTSEDDEKSDDAKPDDGS